MGTFIGLKKSHDEVILFDCLILWVDGIQPREPINMDPTLRDWVFSNQRKFQVPHHFISSIQNLLVVLHNQFNILVFSPSTLFRKKVNQELILVISRSSSFFSSKLWWWRGGPDNPTCRLERLLSQQTLCCLITMAGLDSKHWDLRPATWTASGEIR